MAKTREALHAIARKTTKLKILGKVRRKSARRRISYWGKCEGVAIPPKISPGSKVTWPELKCNGIRRTCSEDRGWVNISHLTAVVIGCLHDPAFIQLAGSSMVIRRAGGL